MPVEPVLMFQGAALLLHAVAIIASAGLVECGMNILIYPTQRPLGVAISTTLTAPQHRFSRIWEYFFRILAHHSMVSI